ncbi:MAG: hypothetical protein V1742_07830 [Pseudomonadota bacterium]
MTGRTTRITRRKKPSLKAMLRRLVVGWSLALLGSWTLAGLRLNVVRELLSLSGYETVYLVTDFAALVIILFGFLTGFSVLSEFRARLDRIEDLGERDW